MNLNFLTALPPPLAAANSQLPTPAIGAAGDFAALLESLEPAITPLPAATLVSNIKTAEVPKEQKSGRAQPASVEASKVQPKAPDKKLEAVTTVPVPAVIVLPDAEPLPAVFDLPIAAAPPEKQTSSPASVEGNAIALVSEQPVAHPLKETSSERREQPRPTQEGEAPIPALLTRVPLPAAVAPVPSPSPSPRTVVKAKSSISSQVDLPSALPTISSKSQNESSPSPIAFEAKLTSKGDSAPGAAVTQAPPAPLPQNSVAKTTSPELPQQESKPREKADVQEVKPESRPDTPSNPAGRASAPHAPDSPAKSPSTTTATVPTNPAANVSDRLPHTATTLSPAAASALDVPDLPPLQTEPARDISFRINATATDAIDVKLVDRAGQIHVAVRSSDPALTQSLQANVGELAGKLERSGFHAETFLPNRLDIAREPQQSSAFQDFQQQERRAPQQDFQQRKKRMAPGAATFSLTPNQENS